MSNVHGSLVDLETWALLSPDDRKRLIQKSHIAVDKMIETGLLFDTHFHNQGYLQNVKKHLDMFNEEE